MAQKLCDAATKAQQPHSDWECINTAAHAAGGTSFIVGSVFFLPECNSNVGWWLFFVGSLFCPLVVLCNCAEVHAHAKHEAASKKHEQAPSPKHVSGTRSMHTLKNNLAKKSNATTTNLLTTKTASSSPAKQSKTQQTLLESLINLIHSIGTIVFTVGSVFFATQVALHQPSAQLFVWGSAAFLVGAHLNVLADASHTVHTAPL